MKARRRGRRRYTKPGGETYVFRLFVAGNESNSTLARRNLGRLCEERLKGRYKIEIVDVLKDAATALKNNILVTPTLVVIEPHLEIKVVGNLSDTKQVLAALQLIENER